MPSSQKKIFQRWALTLTASLVLSACGGDEQSSKATPSGSPTENPSSGLIAGGGNSWTVPTPTDTSTTTPTEDGTSEPSSPDAGTPTIGFHDENGSPAASTPSTELATPIPEASLVLPPSNNIVSAPIVLPDRIALALKSGSNAGLLEEDKLPLVQSATQIVQTARRQQNNLLAELIDDSTAAAVNFTNGSQTITPLLSTSASPLLVANNGSVLASIGNAHGGRALAYGKDLLVQLSSASGTNQAQLPLFKRSFAWLATGKVQDTLPATVRVATSGYDAKTVSTLVARLGSKAEVVSCQINNPANSCWQNADIFVFGQNTAAASTLTDVVARYLQAGKGVMYLHNIWGDSAGGRQVLQAMGMELGGYPGNYFAGADGFQISASKTAAQQRAAADRLGRHESVLLALLNGTNADFSKDSSLISALDGIRKDLLGLEAKGINLFTDEYLQKPYMEAHRRLVLWADQVRQQVDYSKVVRSKPVEFLQTMAADSLSYAVRSKESAPKTFGDWMPTASPNLATSQEWETIDVTIAQTGGNTAIGRGAVPGKPVQIEIVDAAGANLAARIGHVRTRGNPIAQEKYTRPRFPDGHQAALTPGKTLNYTTAWGGPLFLNYNSAKAGSVVKLRIRGGVKYAHFDFTSNPSSAVIDEAVQALQRGDFGWQTSKMVGGEVQQTIGYAKSVIGNTAPRVYVEDRLKGMIFDSNHLANGYNNMAPSANVSSLCTTLGWDCTGPVHNAPGVQHFVGWLAACGFLCSGNPSDGSAGIGPGWGWWHELGHNTVMSHMKLLTDIAKGCPVECDNNILANASALRQYAITNGSQNNAGEQVKINHKRLYQDIVKARNASSDVNAVQAAMFSSLWNTSNDEAWAAMRAVHFQLAFIYTKERLGQAKPQALDVVDFIGMLGRGERLIKNNSTWTTHKDALGMNLYAKNSISNHELLYVLSSRIIGRDMRQVFAHYGIPLSATATNSIAAHSLPVLAPTYYAMVPNQANQLERGQWLDLSTTVPNYPF